MEENSKTFLFKIKSLNFEVFSYRILLGVIALLPLFVLPFGIFAVDFSKAIFVYIGVSISAIFFLLWSASRKSITYQNSFIIKSLFFVSFAWFVSAMFSKNISLSIFGVGYETGTVIFVFYLSVIVFLISVMFRSVEQIAQIYKAIFLSAIVLFVLQFLHTGLGVDIQPWNIFQGKLASVLGNWSDLGIFFGLIVILSLFYIEYGGESRKKQVFLWIILIISLIAVYFVNFSTLQYVLGFFVLGLMTYRIANPPHFEGSLQGDDVVFLSPSLFVFLAVVSFTVLHKWTGGLINLLGIQFTQIAPSWMATVDVIRGALSVDLVFGSGPNTFLYDWLMFRPETISNTDFWDARFNSGSGRLLSMIAETGLLGGIAFATFIASLLFYGRKAIQYKEHSLERMFLVSSFFGTLYLWVFTIIYSPGFLVSIFAGVFTGIFVASLGLVNYTSRKNIIFDKNTRKGFSAYFIALIIMSGFMFLIFVLSSKYIAGYYYTVGLKEATTYNSTIKADKYLRIATAFDPQDVYFRSLSEVGLMRLGEMILRSNEGVSDSDKVQFGNILTSTVQSAKNATIINPADPENWIELGRVYEALMQSNPDGFKSSAVFAYEEALRVSPKDPSLFLALARVELETGNIDDAIKYINEALKIKNNFTVGRVMLAEIAIGQGKLNEAISELEQAIILSPNNPDNAQIILSIGALYFQHGYHEKAQEVIENLVSVNPNYIDARYALGQLYHSMGMTEMAVRQFEAINAIVPENIEVQGILETLRSEKNT